MRTAIVVGGFFLFAAVGLLLAFGPDGRTAVEVGILAVGLLPAVVRHVPWLYLRWSKIWYAARNTAATWDLSIRYQSVGSDAAMADVAEQLVRKYPRGSVIVSTSDTRVVMKLSGRFVLEISEDNELGVPFSTGARQVHVSVMPVTVGYRDSSRFLNRELIPVLGAVRDTLRAERVSYGMRVALPEHNPYFGVYLHQFPSATVRDFRVAIGSKDQNARSHFIIGKDKLTVVSDNFEGFRLLADTALTFKMPEE